MINESIQRKREMTKIKILIYKCIQIDFFQNIFVETSKQVVKNFFFHLEDQKLNKYETANKYQTSNKMF